MPSVFARYAVLQFLLSNCCYQIVEVKARSRFMKGRETDCSDVSEAEPEQVKLRKKSWHARHFFSWKHLKTISLSSAVCVHKTSVFGCRAPELTLNSLPKFLSKCLHGPNRELFSQSAEKFSKNWIVLVFELVLIQRVTKNHWKPDSNFSRPKPDVSVNKFFTIQNNFSAFGERNISAVVYFAKTRCDQTSGVHNYLYLSTENYTTQRDTGYCWRTTNITRIFPRMLFDIFKSTRYIRRYH